MVEVQLKTIIDHHDASKSTLTTMLKNKKDKVHQAVMERRAKAAMRKREHGKSPRNKNINKSNNTHVVPAATDIEEGRAVERRVSGAWQKAKALTTHTSVTHVGSMMQAIQLQAQTVEMTTEVLFEMLGYYGEGEKLVDQKIEAFIQEHTGGKGGGGIDVPRDAHGNTLLVAAVRFQNTKAVQLLLDKGGADPTSSNHNGQTALHYAGASGNLPIVNMLIHEMSLNEQREQQFVQAQDVNGHTAASYAASNGHLPLVEVLGGLVVGQGTTHAHRVEKRNPTTLPPMPRNSQLPFGGESKSGQPPPPPPGPAPSTSSISKWRRAAWVQGVRRYNQKRNANQQLKNAVALMMAKQEVQKKIETAGQGSDARLHQLEDQLETLQQQIQVEHEHSAVLEQHEAELNQKVDTIVEHEQQMEEDLSKEAKARKKLHNQIEDMKGAIRVFCRIRPLSSSELARGNNDITEYLSDKCSIRVFKPIDDGNGGMKKGKKENAKVYTFDSVFSPQDGQEPVFEDVRVNSYFISLVIVVGKCQFILYFIRKCSPTLFRSFCDINVFFFILFFR